MDVAFVVLRSRARDFVVEQIASLYEINKAFLFHTIFHIPFLE